MKNQEPKGSIYILDQHDHDRISALMQKLADELWETFIRRKTAISMPHNNSSSNIIVFPQKPKEQLDPYLDHIF
jgi:hypothetical protein